MEQRISPVPREARPYQGERAGLVTRVIANSVDALSVSAALVVSYCAFNAAMFLLNPREFEFARPSVLLNLTALLVVLVLYLALAWATTGRTYGAHVMGLRVVGRSGHRVRPWMALLRALFSVGFPIGLFWCAVSTSRRSLQDVVLRTAVIYDWRPRHEVEDPAILA